MKTSRERSIEYRTKLRLINPEKYKLWNKAQRNRENKNIPKRNAWKNDYKKRKDYCEICGSRERLEFHHIDYINRSGITVCFNCHRYKIHNKSVEGYKPLQVKRGAA